VYCPCVPQVESVAILTALSAHKTVAPRLVAAKVHTAALRLLPMPASELAPPPILTSTAPISPSTHRARKGPKMVGSQRALVCFIIGVCRR
jgi:hypothetical protein